MIPAFRPFSTHALTPAVLGCPKWGDVSVNKTNRGPAARSHQLLGKADDKQVNIPFQRWVGQPWRKTEAAEASFEPRSEGGKELTLRRELHSSWME